MAHPSSSHRDRDRDDDRATTRERAHRTSSSHHHRTISSTTLLLVLSLILAVLAVMLSLPSRSGSGVLTSPPRSTGLTGTAEVPAEGDGASHSFWGYLTPKRSHALVSRESAVAMREAEVARREAELLAGLPGGLPYACPVCGETVVEEVRDVSPSIALVNRPSVPQAPMPTVTVIKEIEITKEVEPTNPSWLQTRLEGILDREMKISDREKEVGTREESIGRREADTTKREGWIIEHLARINSDVVEEHLAFDQDHPRHYYGEARRAMPKASTLYLYFKLAIINFHHHEISHTVVVTQTETETKFFPPPPAPTRVAARPTPETFVQAATGADSGKTKEVFVELPTPVAVDYPEETRTVWETIGVGRPPRHWGW